MAAPARPPVYPGVAAPEEDTASIGSDLSTVFSNPALWLGAAGILAPQHVTIGNTNWALGPRLSALGQLMGTARAANREQAAAAQMQRMFGGGGAPPTPPGQGAPEGEAGPPLPPGMDRASFLAQLTPEMIRMIGQNPQYGQLIKQAADAQDANAKRHSMAQAAFEQFRQIHPEPVAWKMALAAAESGQPLSEKFMTTSAPELQTQLARAKSEQKIEAALANGLNPADLNQAKQFLLQNPDVSAAQLFARTGNVAVGAAYYAEQVAAINADLNQRGLHLAPSFQLDAKTGAMGIAIAEGPVPMSPADIQKGYMGLQATLAALMKSGKVRDEVGQALQLRLSMAMRNPNKDEYLNFANAITGLYGNIMSVDGQRDLLTFQRIQARVAEVNNSIAEVRKELQGAGYSAFDAATPDAERYIRKNPAAYAKKQALEKQLLAFYELAAALGSSVSMDDMVRAESAFKRRIADIQVEATGATVQHPSGKTWPAVEAELRRQFTKKGLPPAQIEAEIAKQRKVFNSEIR